MSATPNQTTIYLILEMDMQYHLEATRDFLSGMKVSTFFFSSS